MIKEMLPDQQKLISRIAKQYYKISLWLIFGLTIIVLLVMQYMQETKYVNSMAISALYSLVTSIAYIQSWKSIARRSPKALGKFYIAASALRMMAALLVVVIAMAILHGKKPLLLGFIVLFVGYYLVMLAFDCIYFSKVEKKNNIK